MEDTNLEEEGNVYPIHRVTATWQFVEAVGMRSVYANLDNPDVEVLPLREYGVFDEDTQTATVEFVVTDFHAPGDWGVPYISMGDLALNGSKYYFSDSPDHEALVWVSIATTDPDFEGPGLDLNNIQVSAVPTNPEAPNGETVVEIRYTAWDDKSGLGRVSYRLLDPQGISHFEYHYHDNYYTTFFQGDPTVHKEYQINTILPIGSPPGTWGLQELSLSDKAGNNSLFDFVETMHFVVEE